MIKAFTYNYRMNSFKVIGISSFLIASLGLCEDLEQNAQEAVLDTQSMLTNPALRNKAAKDLNTPEALNAIKNAENLGAASGQSEAIFKISSDVFAKMLKDSGGDQAKLQQMMSEAQRNPAQFYDTWTPEQSAENIEAKKQVP